MQVTEAPCLLALRILPLLVPALTSSAHQQENRNAPSSFKTIIEILYNDPCRIKLFRRLENTRKKIINNECAILFNKNCINERLLPKYIFIYIIGPTRDGQAKENLPRGEALKRNVVPLHLLLKKGFSLPIYR